MCIGTVTVIHIIIMKVCHVLVYMLCILYCRWRQHLQVPTNLCTVQFNSREKDLGKLRKMH